MATINQLVRQPRKRIVEKSTCLRCRTARNVVAYAPCGIPTTPKKPNSALRKVCRVSLTNGFEVARTSAVKAQPARAQRRT